MISREYLNLHTKILKILSKRYQTQFLLQFFINFHTYLQNRLRRPLLPIPFILTNHRGRVLPHRHRKLILLVLQCIPLITNLQIIQSEVPLQTRQQNIVRRRLRGLRTKLRNPRILNPNLVKELDKNTST